MDDPRQRHGTHTWDLVLSYHACPQCGLILENRDKFKRQPSSKKLVLSLNCPRCSQPFTIYRPDHGRPTWCGSRPDVDE